MPTHKWHVNKKLRPFGEAYAKCESDIYQRLKKMTDAELRQLIVDFGTVTSSNAWWATYRARPIVLEQAQHILSVRAKGETPFIPVALEEMP